MKKAILDYSTPVEYKILSGTPRLILKRKKGELTVPCPFCGRRHEHSKGDGHRSPHCPSSSKNCLLTAPDGTILNLRYGYIVITVK